MFVGYVIPLKSSRVSEDWSATSALLTGTLQSLLNQSDERYKIVVVCHERPILEEKLLSRIDIIECDFELHRKNHEGKISNYKQIDYILDKNRKLSQGLKHLSDLNASYYMVLDADDLIHTDLTKYILNTNHPNGYIIHKGYEYYAAFNTCIDRDDMDHLCGSTAIINQRQIVIPEVVTDSTMSAFPWCFLSHSDFEGFYADRNKPLLSIPFQSVMYKLGHGQNASDEFRHGIKTKIKTLLKILIRGKRLSAEQLQAFGITV